MEAKRDSLQFVPFSSVVNPGFWDSYSKLKLNELCLSTEPIPISGTYSRWILAEVSPLFHLQYESIVPERKIKLQPGEIFAPGLLINTNTLEDFKKSNKYEILLTVASKIWDSIVSGEAETNPSILSSFLLFIYGDLKKYHYYYWFGFPVFAYPRTFEIVGTPQLLKKKVDEKLLKLIQESIHNCKTDLSYFTLVIEENTVSIYPLSSYRCLKKKDKNSNVWLGFSDPSNLPTNPGWILRNLLTLAAVRWDDIESHVTFGLRERVSSQCSSIGDSFVVEVGFSKNDPKPTEMPAALGWEKNERRKCGPRLANLTKLMDPARMAESAVELNLRLMKWRVDPVIDLDLIKKCRCLLIGSGTLGCNVSRCLLGWGVHKLTLVDSSRVSYSNPVRQSLYNFEDCQKEGKMKSQTAAEALQRIFPRVDAQGVVLSVPMPGHVISDSAIDQVTSDVAALEKLVEDHDAIFLLTDSRESRWLPSLIGASKRKIVLTAALGFDSYLVMRHGIVTDDTSNATETNVGCYFCNDVVAPGDSTSDRTLDQQCTVTRPGISYMASGHIVEMLIDILQHHLRKEVRDSYYTLPHSIRYYLGRRDQLVTISPPFKNCSACSPPVISAYHKEGIQFLLKVFNSPSYLEDVSGLTKLHHESQNVELFEVSDSEEESDETVQSIP